MTHFLDSYMFRLQYIAILKEYHIKYMYNFIIQIVIVAVKYIM